MQAQLVHLKIQVNVMFVYVYLNDTTIQLLNLIMKKNTLINVKATLSKTKGDFSK